MISFIHTPARCDSRTSAHFKPTWRYGLLTAVICLASTLCAYGAEPSSWSVKKNENAERIAILLNDKPFAEYWFKDTNISRPYFANITSPAGVRITRNHPIEPGDPTDHEKLHPGMWLAFGDLSESDNWRLAAPVQHVRFAALPASKEDELKFTVENRYLDSSGREICREKCRYTFRELDAGALIACDSNFSSADKSFSFGDQEEMGLGVRLNREIAVKSDLGGRILNSNGQRNEREAWSKQADWCDYSGTVSGQFLGLTVMPHPGNFRRSWCHCRDNGFMAMNPFGRQAFTDEDKSLVEVQPGDSFRLRYGVMVHWAESADDYNPADAFRTYQGLSE